MRNRKERNIGSYRSHAFDCLSAVLKVSDEKTENNLHLKQIAIPLGLKRELNAILHESMEPGHVTCRSHIKLHTNEIGSMALLWKSYFRYVAATHGEGAVAVFSLLRSLLYLNMFLFIIIISFLVIPQTYFRHRVSFLSSSNTYNTSSTVYTCSKAYNDRINDSTNKSLMDAAYQIAIGAGWLEQTILFYGGYMSVSVSNSFFSYSIPWAYLLTVIAVSIISLCMIVFLSSWTFNVQNNLKQADYSAIVFSSWEYSQQEPNKVNISKKMIFNNIVGKLNDDNYAARFRQLDLLQKLRIYFYRLLALIAIILMLIGSGYTIYSVQVKASEFHNHLQRLGIRFFMEYLPAITLFVLHIFESKLLQLIVSLMDYECDTSIMLILGIQVFIKYYSMVVFMYSLSIIVNCQPRDLCNAGTGAHSCEKILCWETYIGQQFYKLMLGQVCELLVELIFVMLAHAIIKYFRLKRMERFVSFDVSKSALDLIYTQLLVWIGTLYCPLLPGMAMIFLILYFYIKLACCYYAYTPTYAPYKAIMSPSFFMLMIICCYVLSIFSLCYNALEVKLSKGCGPFREFNTIVSFATSIIQNWSILSQLLIKIFISTLFLSLIAVFIIMLIKYYVGPRIPRIFKHIQIINSNRTDSIRAQTSPPRV